MLAKALVVAPAITSTRIVTTPTAVKRLMSISTARDLMRATLALLGLALLGVSGPLVAEDCFAADLGAVEMAADAGKWRQVQNRAEKLDRRVLNKVPLGAGCLRPTLARLAALRAVAKASTGDLAPALWLWLGAESLDAKQLPDLARFPTAAALGVEREAAPLRMSSAPGEFVREEQFRRATAPRLFSTVIGRRLSGSASVTADLTTEGLPARVRISSVSPKIAYAVLDFCSVAPKRSDTPQFSCNQSF